MHKGIATIACIFALSIGAAGCSHQERGSGTPLPPPTQTAPSTPSDPPQTRIPGKMTPSPKVWPEMKIKNYSMIYEYRSAWGSYTMRVTVVNDRVVDAKIVSTSKPKRPAFTEAVTLNELLRAASKDPYAVVDWPIGQAYPTSISFDHPDAYDEERSYTVIEFAETQ